MKLPIRISINIILSVLATDSSQDPCVSLWSYILLYTVSFSTPCRRDEFHHTATEAFPAPYQLLHRSSQPPIFSLPDIFWRPSGSIRKRRRSVGRCDGTCCLWAADKRSPNSLPSFQMSIATCSKCLLTRNRYIS